MTVEDHAAFFPIHAQSAHALVVDAGPLDAATAQGFTSPITCDACHSPGLSFKVVYCVRCHEANQARPLDASHGFVQGYARDDASCLSCHADGRVPAPEPHPYFPIVEDAVHNGATNADFRAREDTIGLRGCVACHKSVADKTEMRCAECHAVDEPSVQSVHGTDEADDPVRASFDNQPADCKVCHASTPVPESMRVAPHERAVVLWPHPDATLCVHCHTAGNGTLELPRLQAPREHAADFGVVRCDTNPSCLGCHRDGLDRGLGCAFETPVVNDGGIVISDAGTVVDDAGIVVNDGGIVVINDGGIVVNDAGTPPDADAGPIGCAPVVPTQAQSLQRFSELGIPGMLTTCNRCHAGPNKSPTNSGFSWGSSSGSSVTAPTPEQWHVAFFVTAQNESLGADVTVSKLYRNVTKENDDTHNVVGAGEPVRAWLEYTVRGEAPAGCE